MKHDSRPIDEREIGRFVRLRLDAGVHSLDRKVCSRLHEARQVALAHHSGAGAAALSYSFAGLGILGWGSGNLRPLLLAAGLAVAIAGSNYLMTVDRLSDLEELDSALLSDDLPISAYLDDGFNSWLANYSQH